MEIVIASKNLGKIREIREILGERVNLLSLSDLSLDIDVAENGESYRENAGRKAIMVSSISKKIALADDSGLEIEALNGAPGVISARFGGDIDWDRKNLMILELLSGLPAEKRKARFVSIVCLAYPNGRVETAEGIVEGVIAEEPKGKGGFGYDPIFYYPLLEKTFAELSQEEKNRISHRAKALCKIKRFLI
ncbi:RdgB/HAM1 family non-canonical purine NTP pyrophosphatase [bacterium]|nr:RdgB/HAM1 family non-canonical purine NTP pyrophosphatase [bacterium]MBU1599317.1 RdgB/HAM1 family non-canonical purine NTP pyrophosphatase [bacterium]MBU2462306.1 RdgB/HAM1 family non-canonical purine NTP pyrophosphatase [bacterium]